MSENSNHGWEPEIGDAPVYQRRLWFVQQIGGFVIIGALVAAALGFFGGSGPFVSASAGDEGNGVSVEYQRQARKRSPLTLRIEIHPGATDSNQVDLRIKRTYLEKFDIQNVKPEPEEVQAGDEFLTYTFQISEPGVETAITFNMQAENFGIMSGEAELDGHDPVSFRQVVFP